MLPSPRKTHISFVSPNALKYEIDQHNRNPPCSIYLCIGEKVVRRQYNLGTTKYLVPRMALPKLLSYAQDITSITACPANIDVRSVRFYVSYTSTYSSVEFFITHIQ